MVSGRIGIVTGPPMPLKFSIVIEVSIYLVQIEYRSRRFAKIAKVLAKIEFVVLDCRNELVNPGTRLFLQRVNDGGGRNIYRRWTTREIGYYVQRRVGVFAHLVKISGCEALETRAEIS